MPYPAHVIQAVEDALAEAFNFHNALDNFLLRSGIQTVTLTEARNAAEKRAHGAQRSYSRAPKRFVVQEILRLLSDQAENYDRCIADLITNLTKGNFPDATQKSLDAIGNLKTTLENDRAEKARIRMESQKRISEEKEKRQKSATEKYNQKQRKREDILNRFQILINEADFQSRGYSLEILLNDLFEIEGMKPRKPFKILGEQIDGSFYFNNQIHFLEAKWVKSPISGSEFGSFIFKIEGKTADTRGLYVSINGFSKQALSSLQHKGALKFVCIDGSHIVRSLSPGQSLQKLLDEVWRHASETGEAYIPVSSLTN